MAATASKTHSLPTHNKDVTTTTQSTDKTTNPRGIPVFPFMSNVNDYIKSPSETESVLTRFQEMISKYQFMQQNVERRAAGLKEKLPEMKRSLDVVKFLLRQKSNADADDASKLETTFQLQDTLYAHASINTDTLDEVYLWLGANVMVAYPLAEAQDLLQGKLDKAKESLVAAEEDLEFLRVQVTTLEVAIARVHNWDVAEKRKRKVEGKGDADDEKQ
ncbi:hypothetical protein R6Q59_010132 [Mikania micrantha]